MSEEPYEDAGADPGYGEVFERAFELAADKHRFHYRKGSLIPYLSHLMSVAALVWEDGGTEDEVAAALLHDVVEDCGGAAMLEELGATFADRPVIPEIVEACSDSVLAPGEPEPPWNERKLGYLASIPAKSAGALRVTTADKLHNARAILADYRAALDKSAFWERFSQGEAGPILWYYRSLVEALTKANPGRLADELARTVDELAAEVGRNQGSVVFEPSTIEES